MIERQKSGKKPFYLQLDGQGIPYGIGRPAWIAVINKLATGLDPPCTHVRKQIFEDVQTFKDRLNDAFEYSGTLNEDYLRGLMGKAVTKKMSIAHFLYQEWWRATEDSRCRSVEAPSKAGLQ